MVDVVRGTKHQWRQCGQLTKSPASFFLKSSLALVFCFLRQLHFTFQGSLFAFASANSASWIESPLDHNTLLTNSTDVPPFCPHFVCKLILEGWGERSLALSSSACFPHFVPTRCASFNRLSVSILAVLYGKRVCLTPQMAPYQFFHSFLFLCGDIFDDGNLLQGCFTLANNYLKWREHTQRNALQHGPRPA